MTTDPSSLLIRCLQQSKKKAATTGTRGAGKHRLVQDEKKRKAQGAAGSSGGAGDSDADGLNAQKKQARENQRMVTVYSKESLLQMSVARLKGICSEKDLAVSGKKIDLVQRILDNQ